MEQIFLELSVAIIIATALAITLWFIKQPTIISYLLAGIIAGPFFLNFVQQSAALDAFAEIGIAFLLFIVGLNMNLSTLKEVGLTSLLTGVGQVVFTSLIGFFITYSLLGFSVVASIYISIAVSFSSTIIIVKLLSDKKDLDTLYGRISVGFLVVQDIIAIFILMLLSSLRTGVGAWSLIAGTLVKLGAVILVLYFISQFVFPKMMPFIAKSQELLFLFSVSWALLLSLITSFAGFSIEIGALMAGISLASTNYHFEISGKIRSLRDFFIVLFFISLGANLSLDSVSAIVFPSLVLSLFILIGNPLVVMAILGLLGYKKRTGFLAGLTVAQISEFSLILVVLGDKLGHLPHNVISIMTITGIVTIAGSTYMIIYNNRLYSLLSRYLSFFEKRFATKEDSYKFHDKSATYEVILFGYNRIGYSLLKTLKNSGKRFLVVDFNPEIIKLLAKEGVESIYGDASDLDMLEEINIERSSMVISTIPDNETNLVILEKVKNANQKCIVITTAHQLDDAIGLYEAGADYVIMPHLLGGEHASSIIQQFGTDMGKFVTEKVKHLNELKHRKNIGYEQLGGGRSEKLS
jgi:Kef-type K+ transport system membrane component KefB/Trk K+ transport system NAD-binding subunit